MAQLPGSHGDSRSASFSAPSPSPGPSNTASSLNQNGASHANHLRAGMPLPGGYPYQTNMGPPQANMRRPSTAGQGNSETSPQQKPISFPYGTLQAQDGGGGRGVGDVGYQYPPSGPYGNPQQWHGNVSSPSSATWASSPSTSYPGYTYQPHGGPSQSSSGASTPALRAPQSSAVASNVNSQFAVGRSGNGLPAELSSSTLPWTGVQQQVSASRDEPQDAKQVMDVLGGSGIDLRAEEEAMRGRDTHHHQPSMGLLNDPSSQRVLPTGSNWPAYTSVPTQNLPPPISSLPYLQLYPLASFVHSIASTHQLGVEPDVLSTLSTAARIRFRNLLENMIASSRQRCWTSHERPPPLYEFGDDDAGGISRKKRKAMYHQVLISDPSKWLTAIEKADRGEEVKARRRRAQRQREAMMAAATTDSTAQGGSALPGSVGGVDGEGDDLMGVGSEGGAATPGGEGQGTKKKGKPLSAKNMSEDVRRRLANNTAARALGGASTPKWMMMGTGSAPGSGAFSTPTRMKEEAKGGANGETPPPAFGAGAGGLSSLPKPRFGPAATSASTPTASGNCNSWARGLAPSGLAGTPLRPGDSSADSLLSSNKVNPQGWGDLAQRALAKEEEEKRKKKRINLQDVYHAVETERRGGIGRGSGEKTTWRWRNLGPEVAKKSAPSAGGGSGR